ncbi:MAG TPA: RsmB/NOP family class I SAM-dependent RNA methyltransferase, partial [Bauldia sp.]|nr:RsmB/NOP family class I SAM-dependent RNA methyltransferase [Bauldia sp.]
VATYGEATAAAIAAAHRLEPALDVSVKADAPGWAERLGGVVLPTGSVRTLASGDIAALPGFDDGAWWVQDAAAALPARLLGRVAGLSVADLCAAPGGKTAELAAAGAAVTAVEISGRRASRLRQNLARLGLAAEVVTADVLGWQPPALFDAVLLDAPCAATGTIRRHPDVAWLKKPEDIAALAAVQARMLTRAATLLKPGGRLVYCTCSLEPEEGEAHLSATLAALPLVLDPVMPAEVGGVAGIARADGTVRTLACHLPNANPRLAGLDGFFMMRLRRVA